MKKITVIVATDVAARGIDVNDLTHVINYNLPDQNEAYTHRSGRTGRANKQGISVAIITPKETRRIREIENIIGKKFEYKQVPNKEDIMQKQIDIYLDEIEAIDMSKIDNEECFSKAIDRLKKITER